MAEDVLKREARWLFCLALYNWKEMGARDISLLDMSIAMHYPFSEVEVREIIRYLEELELCRVEELPEGRLLAIRTRKLVDLVEYNADAPPSIARPDKRYW